MPLPPERVVKGRYVNPVNGEPYDGSDGDHYIVFEPVPDRWTDQTGKQILLGGGRVTLDANGAFSEDMTCTDAPGVLPADGRLWRLRQFVGGAWAEPQLIAVPVGDGTPLDISDLLSVEINNTPYVPVEGPQGPTGPQGPQGENGFDGSLDTGILFGGEIGPSPSGPAAVDIDPLVGRIVDYSFNPPIVTSVESTETITVELDSIALTRTVTWLLMDASLNVFQQEDRPSPADRRNFLVLGMVLQAGGSIFLAQSISTIIEQAVNQFYDLLDAIGAFNMTGNAISPNGANLLLNHSPGQVFSRGWNHYDAGTRTNSPHIATTVGATPASWIHALRDSGINPSLATPTVDVGHYDLAGTLTAVGGAAGRSVVHQLWMYPTSDGSEIRVIQYGQQVFDTLDDAEQAAATTSLAVNPALPGNAIPLAYLAVKHTATDLSDPAQAKIIPISTFGSGGGGGGGNVSGYAQLTGAEFTGPTGALLPSNTSVAQYTRVTGGSQDRLRVLADGTHQWGSGSAPLDAELRRLAAGVLAFLGTDLMVTQEGGKGQRMRQSGPALDLEAAAADLYVSVYELANFGGTQHTYLRLEAGAQLAHAIGKWIFSDAALGAAVHTLDAAGNALGFHGATPVTRQTVTGNRSTGGALASLLSRLNTLGLITDSSDPGPALLQAANNLSDLTNPATARNNLGLGTQATKNAPAYRFDVTDYGAIGDGKMANDGAMTSGSPVLTCATSAPFTVGDIGKSVLVLNAGASNETLIGTVTSYIGPTQVTLSVGAGSTVSGMPVMWATDDTAAIQAAVDAAVAYALAHSYAATVLIPPAAGAFYGIAGPLKTGAPTLGNAQITLPVVPVTGRKLTLTIEGVQTAAGVQHWQQALPNTTGTTLVSFGLFANSTAQINSVNANGNPAVIGGPSQPGGYGVTPGNFSNIYVDIGNLSILTCHSKFGFTYTAIDLSGIANAQLRDLMYATSGTVAPPGASYQNPNVFATGLSIGCLLPANGNNDNTIVRNVTIGGGYTYAMLVTEHTDIYALRILYCWAALCPVGTYYGSVGAAHSIHGSLISIENCTFLVYVFGPGTNGLGPTMYLKIDTETSTPRFGDRSSGTGLAAARGEVILAGLFTASNLTLDAPTGLRIRNSQVTFPVVQKTASYTAGSFDEVILADAASGGITINLPTAVNRTDPITVKKIDSSGNTVTLDGSGSQTIDGAATKILTAQWETVTIIPSQGNWYII